MDTDAPSVGHRVRAARIQAGYKQRKRVTDQLRLPRFGDKVLGQVERGQRPLYEHEAEELARVLEVDPESFYATHNASQLDRIEAGLDRNNRLLMWIGSRIAETPMEEFERAFTEREADESRARDTKPPAHGGA